MDRELVYDVTHEGFDAAVIERSHDVPVVVDFWAPWCGPCRVLGPELERLAHELGGRFVLAKANTEAEPALGSRFRVQSIPAVKLFHRGRVIGEFIGALPGSQVRRFLDTHLPSAPDVLVDEAREHLAAADPTAAREALREALELDETHAAAHLLLARLALQERELAIAEHHLDAIGRGTEAYEEAEQLRQALGRVPR